MSSGRRVSLGDHAGADQAPRRPALHLETMLDGVDQHWVPADATSRRELTALREGRDVVVQAPTGAGKTLIFELWCNQGRNRGQAIYTVPTRALANDKLAEWRARGWNAGIATRLTSFAKTARRGCACITTLSAST